MGFCFRYYTNKTVWGGEMNITIRQMCPCCMGSGKEVKQGLLFPYQTNKECNICKGEKIITTFDDVETKEKK